MARTPRHVDRRSRWEEATWVAVGVVAGAAVGVAVGGGAGIAVGVALGAGIGVAIATRHNVFGRQGP